MKKKTMVIEVFIFLILVLNVPLMNGMQMKLQKEKISCFYYREYFPGVSMDDPSIVYYEPDEVIVRFFDKDVSTITEFEGAQVINREQKMDAILVKVTDMSVLDYIKLVETRNDVRYAELNVVAEACSIPCDPHWDKQWGNRAINCMGAWDFSINSSNVKIGVLDSGIDLDHEDIQRWRCNHQYDFVNKDIDAYDDNGHGTHGIGLIMADHDNYGIAGVAPDCGIIPVKVLNYEKVGNVFDTVNGMFWVLEYADIISISISWFQNINYLEDVCNFIYNNSKLMIASIGNVGHNWPVGFPAAYNNVIGVGAVEWEQDSDGDDFPDTDELAAYEGNTKGTGFDLVAPGVGIYSTLPGNNYGYQSGTSSATSYVSGIAALIMSTEITDDYDLNCNGRWDPEEVKKKLLYSTIKEPFMDTDHYGAGIVNAYRAVKPGISELKLAPESWDVDIILGESKSKSFTWENIGTGWAEDICASLTGDLDDFYFSSDHDYSTRLTPGETDSVIIIFDPSSQGRKHATLHLNYEGGEELTAELVGTVDTKTKSLHVLPKINDLTYDFQLIILKFLELIESNR